MIIRIHSYLFDLEYTFPHAALISHRGETTDHRHSLSNPSGQKDSRTLPGHTGFWNLARLQHWNCFTCFLDNSLGLNKIPILISKSQWKIHSSGRCLIESGLLEKYSDINYHSRILKGHWSCRDDYCSFNPPFPAR